MPRWRAFAHLVWATKRREPLIGTEQEVIIRRSFVSTLDDLGVIPHAIGFMPDHVHVTCSIPPAVAVAVVVKRLKGASSHAVNHASGHDEEAVFRWQREYGYVSVGEKHLPEVVRYIQNQRARHAAGRLWPTLEDDGGEDEPTDSGDGDSAPGPARSR